MQIYEQIYDDKYSWFEIFIIYVPWGRPDMMIMKYLIASKKNKNFLLFNKGDHFRDFTYIDDAINICEQLIDA